MRLMTGVIDYMSSERVKYDATIIVLGDESRGRDRDIH